MNAVEGSPFSVTVLGCSGSYSSADSPCSSYLFQSASTSVLVDAGPGSGVELQRHLGLAELDGIILSHEHPDHWMELPALYHGYRYYLEQSDLPVYGTLGTFDMVNTVVPEANSTAFRWTTIDETSQVQIGDIAFRFSRTDHPVETLAVLGESDGQTIGYSADTGPRWSPESFNDAIDLFIYDMSIPNEREGQDIPHASGREAGIRAQAAGVNQLVVTHVPPGEDPEERRRAAAEVFDGQILVAAPGRRFSV